MARNAKKGINAANKAGKEVTDELSKLGATDDELKAITNSMDAEDAARAADQQKVDAFNADKQLQAKEWEQQFADIQANRAAGLNDDGSRIIDANATKQEIADMRSGVYSSINAVLAELHCPFDGVPDAEYEKLSKVASFSLKAL